MQSRSADKALANKSYAIHDVALLKFEVFASVDGIAALLPSSPWGSISDNRACDGKSSKFGSVAIKSWRASGEFRFKPVLNKTETLQC
jgi:hypothetical protein